MTGKRATIIAVGCGICLMVMMVAQGFAASGSITVSASVSKTNITIGEKVVYEVVVSYSEPIAIMSNIPIDNLSAVSVLKEFPQEVSRNGYNVTITKQCVITSYDVGEITIPAIKVLYRDDQASRVEKTLVGDALVMTVRSVAKKSDVDDIRDLKPAVDVLETLKKVVKNTSIVLFLVGVCVVVVVLVVRARRRTKIRSIELNLTPYEYALKQLWDLKQAQLIEKGEYRVFAGELTDILRRFLVKEFAYEIMELTTYELNVKLREYGLPDNLCDRVIMFLDECDVVKFAKIITSKERLAELITIAELRVKELFEYHEKKKEMAANAEVKQ